MNVLLYLLLIYIIIHYIIIYILIYFYYNCRNYYIIAIIVAGRVSSATAFAKARWFRTNRDSVWFGRNQCFGGRKKKKQAKPAMLRSAKLPGWNSRSLNEMP